MILTVRERQVLQCILEGLRDKDVAVKLNMSLRTAKHYASRLYRKHSVQTRIELIRKFYLDEDWGKLSPEEQRICQLSIYKTTAEIAKITGKPEVEINEQLRIAYRILRVDGQSALAEYLTCKDRLPAHVA